jgi:hypothetical protein
MTSGDAKREFVESNERELCNSKIADGTRTRGMDKETKRDSGTVNKRRHSAREVKAGKPWTFISFERKEGA